MTLRNAAASHSDELTDIVLYVLLYQMPVTEGGGGGQRGDGGVSSVIDV